MATPARGFSRLITSLVFIMVLGLTASAAADSGPYIGASLGQAEPDIDFGADSFSDDDTAWKVFGGYNFDVLLVNLAVEVAYVDFGSPGGTLAGSQVDLDADAFAGFGVAGLDLGFFGLFAKAGLANWDASVSAPGLGSGSDSGTDPVYGVGARLTFGSVEIRAEYEYYDLDVEDTHASDLSMVSVGAAWTF